MPKKRERDRKVVRLRVVREQDEKREHAVMRQRLVQYAKKASQRDNEITDFLIVTFDRTGRPDVYFHANKAVPTGMLGMAAMQAMARALADYDTRYLIGLMPPLEDD